MKHYRTSDISGVSRAASDAYLGDAARPFGEQGDFTTADGAAYIAVDPRHLPEVVAVLDEMAETITREQYNTARPKLSMSGDNLVDAVETELKRRAEEHTRLASRFWADPDATVAALGKDAGKVITSQRASAKHIAEMASALGVDVETLVPAEYLDPPRKAAINADGTAKLAR